VPAKPVRYVLDSFALLAYLEDEPGRARVQAILEQGIKGSAEIFFSIVNYGEVVYITEREQGLTRAQSVIAAVDQLPITLVDADRALTFAAAHLKAKKAIAYADAFAVALTQSKGAKLLTGDPELHAVEGEAEIEWILSK
jgi:predicted nucleic acid-binding protein